MNQVKKFIRKNPLAFAGILIWIVFIIFALFAPVIATCDPGRFLPGGLRRENFRALGHSGGHHRLPFRNRLRRGGRLLR